MAVAFRASASGKAESGGQVAVTIPSTVQAGDLLILGYIINSLTSSPGGQAAIATPPGWTAIPDATQADTSAEATVFYKIATTGDAGSTVTVTYTGSTDLPRNCAILVAYSGVDQTAPFPVTPTKNASSSSSATHVMPTLDTTGHDQAMIVSLLLERAATASSKFTVSSGWTLRQSQITTGSSGQPEAAAIDAGPVATGAAGQGSATITADQASNHAFGYTFALAPATAVQTARPNVDVTTANWTPSQAPGAGVPMCSLVADGSDATYVETVPAPTNQRWEAKIPKMGAAPNTVMSRFYCAGGATSATAYVALMQGTTVIASTTQTWQSDPPTSPTEVTVTLTDDEKTAVTDLSDLRIRAELTVA